MTDRELIELAAKAAGHEIMDRDDDGTLYVGADDSIRWNPLTDDGDALRLAVMLQIHVQRYQHMVTARNLFGSSGFDERDGNDPFAATRRAIVRAAAEIGKSIGDV